MKKVLDKKDISIDKKYILKRDRYFILMYYEDNHIYRSQMFSIGTDLSNLFKYAYKIDYRKWEKSLALGFLRQDLYKIESFSEVQSVVIMQELIG